MSLKAVAGGSGGNSGGVGSLNGLTGSVNLTSPDSSVSIVISGQDIQLETSSGTGFVPYTGATADVDLGAHNLTTNKLTVLNSSFGGDILFGNAGELYNDGVGNVTLTNTAHGQQLAFTSSGAVSLQDSTGSTGGIGISGGNTLIRKNLSIESGYTIEDSSALTSVDSNNRLLKMMSGGTAIDFSVGVNFFGVYSFPNTDALLPNQVLSSNALGVLNWQTTGEGFSSLTTFQVAFGDPSGVMTSDPAFSYNPGPQILQVPNVQASTILNSSMNAVINLDTDQYFDLSGGISFDADVRAFSDIGGTPIAEYSLANFNVLTGLHVTDFLSVDTLASVGVAPPIAGSIANVVCDAIGNISFILPSSIPGILSVTHGISGTVPGNSGLYLVPGGKTALITGYLVLANSSSGPGSGPSAGLGNAPGVNNISAIQAMTALNATNSVFTWNSLGISVATVAGNKIYFNLSTPATVMSESLTVFLFGFLI